MAKKLTPKGKDAPQPEVKVEKVENGLTIPSGKAENLVQEKTVVKRRLEKTEKVHHDLFRLEISNTRKDIGYNPDKPIWEVVPHKHFYHTVTSDGKPLKHSSPTAGHFHEVKVTVDEEGNFTDVECGPPMVMHKGSPHSYRNDKHIHDVSYLVSEIVEKRISSKDAQKVMAYLSKEENDARKGVSSFVKG